MKLLSKAFAGRRDRRGNAGGFYSRCVRNHCLLRECLLAHPRDICLSPRRAGREPRRQLALGSAGQIRVPRA
jgi:hypothetical protein